MLSLTACVSKRIVIEDYCLIYQPVYYPLAALKLAPRAEKIKHKDNNDYYDQKCLNHIKS